MGKLINGSFGHITGRVGDMVFYVLNGENVARHVGKNIKPPSEAQLANQAKMVAVGGFLKPILEFINIGFAFNWKNDRTNPHNRAVSYNRMNAITGVYPDFVMDYSKVLVSKGALLGAVDTTVGLVPEGLRFGWSYTSDMPYPRENDRVMLLAYFPELGSSVYVMEGAVRKTGTDVLAISEELMTATMEVYISFVSADGKSVSDSVYLRRVN